MEGAAQAEAQVSSGRAWWAVAVLMLLCFVAYLDRQIITLMVDPIRRDLGVSDFQISLLQGLVFAIFYATLGIPLGWAADRFPRRHIIFGGLGVWAICASACGLAGRYWQLLAARLGVGAGEAALFPSAYSLISQMFPPQRLAFAMSVFTSGNTLGGGAAMALGGLLISKIPDAGVALPLLGLVKNWQMVFLITGLPGLALGWLIYTIKEPSRPKAAAHSTKADLAALRAYMWRNRRFYIGHALGFSCNSLVGYGFALWVAVYVSRRFHWDMAAIGGALGIIHVTTGVLGALGAGAVIDAWFRRGRTDAHLRFYAFAGLFQIAVAFVAFTVSNPYLFFAAAAVNQLFVAFTGGAGSALQIVTPPEFRGRVTAIYLLVQNVIGLGCGASVVAAFTDFLFHDDAKVGWSIALTYAIFLPISAFFLLYAGKQMRSMAAERGAVGIPPARA